MSEMDKELRDWLGEYLVKPWSDWRISSDQFQRAEQVSKEKLLIPFTPLTINAREVLRCLRYLGDSYPGESTRLTIHISDVNNNQVYFYNLSEQYDGSGRFKSILIEPHEIKKEDHIPLKKTHMVNNTEALSKEYGLPAINISEFSLDEEAVVLIPFNFAKKHSVIAVNKSGSTLILAMSDPTNIWVIEEIKYMTGYKVEVVVAQEEDIQEAIERNYATVAPGNKVTPSFTKDLNKTARSRKNVLIIIDLEIVRRLKKISVLNSPGQYLRSFVSIIKGGVKQNLVILDDHSSRSNFLSFINRQVKKIIDLDFTSWVSGRVDDKSRINSLVLRGPDFILGLKLGGEDEWCLSVEHEATEGRRGQRMKDLARAVARAAKMDTVLAMEAEPLRELVREVRRHNGEWTIYEKEDFLECVLGMLRDFGSVWSMYPVPAVLHPVLRKVVLGLGLRYDISRLDAHGLPRLIIEGAAVLLGWIYRFAMFVTEHDKLTQVIIMEFYQGGIKRVYNMPVEPMQDIFKEGIDGLEALKEAKYRVWERDGWVNYAVLMDKELLAAQIRAASLLGMSVWRSMVNLPRLIKLVRLLVTKPALFYPNEGARDLEPWVKQEGLWRILYRGSQLPFLARRPKTRGLLYIKETAMLIIGLAIVACLVLWLA